MKLIAIGGAAGIIYPVSRVLAALSGPTDRMQDYPRFVLEPRTGSGYAAEAVSLACLLVFVVALPSLATATARGDGKKHSATVAVVLLAAWGLIRFGACFVGPYLELTVVASSAFLLGTTLFLSARMVAGAHPILGYLSLLSALLLLVAGATVFLPLGVSDASSLGLGLIYSDPGPMGPGGLAYTLGLASSTLWVAAVGFAMLKYRNQAG